MLRFLKDENLEDKQKQTANGNPDAKTQSASGQPNGEYLTVAKRSRDVRKTTSLLAISFGIGLLLIWFMIRTSVPKTASAATSDAETSQIEVAIARLTGISSEMFVGVEKIVKKFYEFSDVKQVAVDELAKNPFKQELLLANAKEKSDIGEVLTLDASLAKRRLNERLKDLRLSSIVRSNKGNCCMINDSILYQGDSINGFEITQIGDNFVKLESEGVETVLSLELDN